MQAVVDVLVLQAAQALVGAGNGVEDFQHLGLELGLDGRERERILHVVVVEFAFAGRRGFAIAALARGALAVRLEGRRRAGRLHRRRLHERRRDRGCDRRDLDAGHSRVSRVAWVSRISWESWHSRHAGGHRLGIGTGIGRFEIDDVAQEDLAVVELVAPDDDGLEGERALAQPRDHRFAAGLDALGDGDLALAGEQFHRAHFAKVHSYRIVGALGRLLGLGLGRDLLLDLDQFALGLVVLGLFLLAFLAGLVLFLLDHVDAHFVEHREHVFDLIGGDFLRGHHGIDLVMGDVAALLGELDHLLDGGVR